MKIITKFGIVAVISILLGCSQNQGPNDTLSEIRIGVLPDQKAAMLETRYAPLLKHIAEQTGIKTKLVIPESYDQLLTLFQNRDIDLAYFGGATFVKAKQQAKAEPLTMRDVDAKFTSLFIVSAKDKHTKLEDYKSKRLSFGSKLSTSGHFMPRFYLSEKSIEPEQFFSEVVFSGAHDKTAELVRDGKADIGVANSHIIRDMFTQGRLKKEDVKILWETPPYPDYVWAIQHDTPKELKDSLRWAFLDLRMSSPDQKTILTALGSKGFLPAENEDFMPLEKVMSLLDK